MFAEGPEWRPEGEAELCEQCGLESASVHVVRVEDGDVTQSHLCQDCAGELAQQGGRPALVFALPLPGGGLRTGVTGEAEGPGGPRPEAACPACGTTSADLSETGLVGCALCYEVFADRLTPSGGGTGSGVRHLGKAPHRAVGGTPERQEVLRLNRMLRELVETERFEEAAVVRDRLLELGHDPGRGRR